MSASKIVMRLVSISFSALVFLVVVYGLYQLGLRSYSYGYRIFTEPAVTQAEGRDRLVQIKNSMSASDIGELLEEKGLIRDRWLFVIQLKLSEYSNKITAGYYTLNTSMTSREMMQIMSGEETEDENQKDKQDNQPKENPGKDAE